MCGVAGLEAELQISNGTSLEGSDIADASIRLRGGQGGGFAERQIFARRTSVAGQAHDPEQHLREQSGTFAIAPGVGRRQNPRQMQDAETFIAEIFANAASGLELFVTGHG
jgi:hypothetical protein